MKKSFLFCLVLGLAMISCHKEDTANDDQNIVVNAVEEPEIPTEDLMSVTTGIETITYGEFYPGFSSHFLSRIKNRVTVYDENTTKACVINDNAIRDNLLSAQDYINIYNCYANGGIIVVLNPTVAGFNTKFQPEMALAEYYKKVTSAGLLVNDEVPAMDEFVVDNPFFRVNNISETALQGGIVFDAIAFCGNNIHYFEDLDASRQLRIKMAKEKQQQSGEAVEEEKEVTAYDYGCYADALARWMNEKWSSPTKSGIDNAINKGLVIESSHPILIVDDCYNDAIKQKLTINAIHDFERNRDYYLVDQDVTFFTSKIHPVPLNPDGTPDLTGVCWLRNKITNPHTGQVEYGGEFYIKSFDRWIPRIEMSVNGQTATLETFSPQAGNSTSTETHSSTTETSYTIGGSVGFSSNGLSVGLDASYTEKHSVTVGCSRPKQDIEISCISEDGNCAVWLYEATRPKPVQVGQYVEWRAGRLLFTTMMQTNSVLFYVDNPSGKATLKVSNQVEYIMSSMPNLKYTSHCGIGSGEPCRFGQNNPIELPLTKRSRQNWNFSFDLPEALKNRSDSDEIVDRIWEKMETAMGKIYPGGPVSYEILDVSDTTIDNARILLNMITKQLGLIAKQYGYTGTFTVYLKCEKTGKELKQKITVS